MPPKLLSVEGITIFSIDETVLKLPFKYSTPSSIISVLRFSQSGKTALPTLFTWPGIVNSVINLHPTNASWPIEVTYSGITL